MYKIEIPPPVPLRQLDGKHVLDVDGNPAPDQPFHAFVDERTCDPLFAGAKGADQSFTVPILLAAMRCSSAARIDSEKMLLDDADYARLRRATEAATYHPAAGRCYLPHILAILHATVVE